MTDPRLAKAYADLHAAQDRYSAKVDIYRAAQRAYARSRSKKNRDALIAASDACDAELDTKRHYDEIDRIEQLIAREHHEAAAAAEAAIQPMLF